MSKRPSDERLRSRMNEVALALLDAHYGHLLSQEGKAAALSEAVASDTTTPVGILPKPDVFNAVVNWLRTDSGMEPLKQEKSGIAALREERDAARK